jgi:heme exporter protein A
MIDNHIAPLLEARSLHLWRGERHLLRDVSFELSGGQLLQVGGPNGVGKSTLLRATCGLLPLEAGDLFWSGTEISKCRTSFNGQLAYLAHSNALKNDLTASENLRFELSLRRNLSDADVATGLERLKIPHCAQLPARVLSAGQRRRLAFTRVLLSQAALWILDEPTTNLDSAGIELVEQLIAEHLRAGGSVLAAAHHGLLQGNPAVHRLELQ